MKTLTVATEKPYDILVGAGILQAFGKTLKERFGDVKVAIVTDDIVEALYGNTLRNSLKEEGYTPSTYVFANGEDSKNIGVYENILDFLGDAKITRKDLVIALGGGVVGDITGFAAATYLRGISYIQIPTTLLAAVDSSVGGKTAVNLRAGKNLAGAFWQPALVYCDYETMTTMEKDRFADGVAEAIKYGVLQDPALFALLKEGEPLKHMEEIILTCLKIKRDLVMEDEWDKGRRQLLNLGHTLGHAIEKKSDFAITHGHAVAIGMVFIAKIAEGQGLTEAPCAEEIEATLKANDLPTVCPYAPKELISLMEQDKKRQGSTLTFVIPKAIGKCILYPVAINDLTPFLTGA